MTTRRSFLAGLAALTAATGFPGLSLARLPTERRLVVVLLRGGLDSLATIVPWADPDYRSRGALALPGPDEPDGVIDLDGSFGLHPSLEAWSDLWEQGALLPVHAVASPYRERSHFDAQNLLDTGATRPYGAPDGWLSRALTTLEAPPAAVALGKQVPLLLRGDADATSVTAGQEAPEEAWFEAVRSLYAGDPLLGPALEHGIAARDMVEEATEEPPRGRGRRQPIPEVARLAGALLAAADGPRIAVIEASGWDTHAAQGTTRGSLANRLAGLGDGVAGLARALGPAWDETVVVIASEFGRTVHANGTGGSDHGTGGAVVLAGGAVAGGRVLADWPGLATRHLLDGRDLAPTRDVRAVFKAVLRDHLGVSEAALAHRVFPDSASVLALDGLIRA